MRETRAQVELDENLAELEQKKNSLRQKLSSVERLDLLINVITYKIFDTQYKFRQEKEGLDSQKDKLRKSIEHTPNELAILITEVDNKLTDVEKEYETIITGLEEQRSELQKEYQMHTQQMDITMSTLKVQYEFLLQETEILKIGASSDVMEELDKRIGELHRMLKAEIDHLTKLQEQGWKSTDSEEKLAAALEANGLRVTPNGKFLTSSGHILTRSEVSRLGLLKELDCHSWHSVLQGHREKANSNSMLSHTSSSERMLSEDIHYLKHVLGKPLILALAEITAVQPRDPIHYLGHWLFKYRYNQELDVLKKQEVQELIEQRDNIEKVKMHTLIENEARAAVLGMVIEAEERAIRNELLRIARETAMLEEEEYDPEARDTLGHYDGPSTSRGVDI